MSDSDHSRLMEAGARHFFGEPNGQLSKNRQLRFGTNGSKEMAADTVLILSPRPPHGP